MPRRATYAVGMAILDTSDDSGGLVFGRHTYDPARCELRSDGGRAVALGQRAGRLLQALIEAGGRVLSRDQLLQRAWPGQDIDDGNLRVQIAALRRALADDRELIGTVAGRGYLFAGRVHADAEQEGRAGLPQPSCVPVGRTALVEDVLARCAPARLVTLAGTAGIGKTAVALAAAHRHAGEAAWVELDAVQSSAGGDAEIVAAIAAALDLPADAGGSARTLAARLGGRALLLVLDNCEHLADACSRLAETLLGACPSLALLVTSRQPLLAAGEVVVRVPALALPVAGETDAATLSECSAVQLFVQRAGDDAGDLATIGAICRRLDGVPLALELAAARVPSLGIARVAEELDDMLRLLQGGCALPRHRTLHAALDWSYVLLPADAQLALCRLARLRAWFTLDHAAAVLRHELCMYRVIDSLSELAAHSLLVVDHGSVIPRYRLLATTRAFALARQAH